MCYDRKPRKSRAFVALTGTDRKGWWRRGWDFEPTVRIAYNGFRDRPVRPLRHPSARRPRSTGGADPNAKPVPAASRRPRGGSRRPAPPDRGGGPTDGRGSVDRPIGERRSRSKSQIVFSEKTDRFDDCPNFLFCFRIAKLPPGADQVKMFLLIRDTPHVRLYVLNMFRMRGSRLWGSRLHRACVV